MSPIGYAVETLFASSREPGEVHVRRDQEDPREEREADREDRASRSRRRGRGRAGCDGARAASARRRAPGRRTGRSRRRPRGSRRCRRAGRDSCRCRSRPRSRANWPRRISPHASRACARCRKTPAAIAISDETPSTLIIDRVALERRDEQVEAEEDRLRDQVEDPGAIAPVTQGRHLRPPSVRRVGGRSGSRASRAPRSGGRSRRRCWRR